MCIYLHHAHVPVDRCFIQIQGYEALGKRLRDSLAASGHLLASSCLMKHGTLVF